jgi:hypothetical protein
MQSPSHVSSVSAGRLICGTIWVNVIVIITVFLTIFLETRTGRLVCGVIAISVVIFAMDVCLHPERYSCMKLPVVDPYTRYVSTQPPITFNNCLEGVQQLDPQERAELRSACVRQIPVARREKRPSGTFWPRMLLRPGYQVLSDIELSVVESMCVDPDSRTGMLDAEEKSSEEEKEVSVIMTEEV